MEKISIASYAFHGLVRAKRMNIFGYLESCKHRYGAQADIWIGMLESLDDDYLNIVKQELDARDLKLANLCVDGPHLWVDDAEQREAHYQKALDYMHAAEVLGAKTVRLDAGGAKNARSFTAEQMDYIAMRYKEYCQRAYDNGYKFGPENHWGPEVIPANMMQIVEAVDHPGFGILLHFRDDEGDVMMAPYAMHTHVHWKTCEGDLKGTMDMMRGIGYDGYWGVEHHTGKNEYTEVAMQVAAVRDVLDRWKIGE